MDPAFFTVRTPHPHTHQQHLHRMYEPPGMPAWTGMHACCCSSCYAHELMQHPWIGILCLCSTLHGRHPKKSFSKILEAVSRPEFAQDHESGLRSDRGPVVLCDFSKLRFRKSPYDFLNLYGRFCPYNPPYNPGHDTLSQKMRIEIFTQRKKTGPGNFLPYVNWGQCVTKTTCHL